MSPPCDCLLAVLNARQVSLSTEDRMTLRYRLSLSGEAVDGLAAMQFEAVGLVRGEFILRERLESLRVPAAREALQRYLSRVAEEFQSRSVWYRLVDLWSDEAAVLAGTPHEEREHNPMLGQRGVRRGLADHALLQTELRLVVDVARQHRNLHILVPFVQDAGEFSDIAEKAIAAGHPNRLGSMLEVPSALLDAGAFARAGATNLLIGMNDLSCLLLGRDRGPKDMKLHAALWRLIKEARDALPSGIELGIGGSLGAEVLARADAAGIQYASLHYSEAAALLSLPAAAFPHAGHVRRIKEVTVKAKIAAGLHATRLADAVAPHRRPA